mgnify:CR=1 FL=1
MPELPEVETIRRALAPLVTGRRVIDAGGHPSAKFSSAPAAIGATIAGVDRRGKYLLLPLSTGDELVVHLGMTGKLRLRPSTTAPDDDGFVRAWWELDDGQRLELHDVRRFGRVAVVAAGDHAALPTLAALGPEPFDPSLTGDALWQSLRRSRTRVKTQLLSQRPIAGVGNIYADEALWRARVHPARRTVTRAEAARLLEALRDVLDEGIRHGGTTLRDYRSVDGSEGENQHHLDCYGRGGEPCRRCGAVLRRREYDGRTATFCPSCQPNR